jgi:Fe-S-cluster containining protein
MTKTILLNLRSFRQKVRHNKRSFRRFLTKLEKNIPRNADQLTSRLDKEVWKEVDCLHCANCCKQMSPTYSAADIKRIAAYKNMSADEFKNKWLYKDRSGDWMNKSTPCQFLDLSTNMCGIYEVRPADCAGFPHLAKRKLKDYIHVHKQNVEFCPATYKMVEKMMEAV